MSHRTLQLRRGTKTELPTLSIGELGYCTDTKELYIGNGIGDTRINPLVVLNGDNGILVKTASDTFTNRTITGNNGITITNGDGISGDPTIEPNYGSGQNTVCEGNDSRLLSTATESTFVSTFIKKLPTVGIESLTKDTNHVYLLTNQTDTNYMMMYNFKNQIDSSAATKAAIYGTVIDDHTQYTSSVKLSGDIDSANFTIEWNTFVADGNNVQIGEENISNGTDSVSVVFDTAMPNTDYSLVYAIKNMVDASPAQYTKIITQKLTTGFTVKLSGNTDSSNYKLVWAVQTAIADIQSGTQPISNGSNSVDVTLTTQFDNTTDYVINAVMINTADISPSQYEMIITSKTKTGFTIGFSGNMDTANYNLLWTVDELDTISEDFGLNFNQYDNFDGGSFT